MHWTKISESPNAPEVRKFLNRELTRLLAGRIRDSSEFLRLFVTGRDVLDIGVVQHEASQFDKSHWKHGKIVEWARRTTGIDVLEDGVRELVARGFQVECVDATSDYSLGRKFERIVAGDVIEHVSSAVDMLRFAKRHLAAGGRLMCTTPNPLFLTYTFRAMREGMLIPNAEHVAWISPTMALELGHRAGLRMTSYWLVQGEGRTPLRRLAALALDALNLRNAEPFSASFCYIYEAES